MTGRELAREMIARGLSDPIVAQATGYSPRAVKAYRYGEREVPDTVAAFVLRGEVLPRVAPAPPAPYPRVKYADERKRFRDSIARMCKACEPDEGACRDASCPLRPVSPLAMSGKPFGEPLPGGDDTARPAGEWPPYSDATGRAFGSLVPLTAEAQGAYGGGLS